MFRLTCLDLLVPLYYGLSRCKAILFLSQTARNELLSVTSEDKSRQLVTYAVE
jgi:hypothetical protein